MKLAQIAALRSRLLLLIAGEVPDTAFGVCNNLSYYPDTYDTTGVDVDGYGFVADNAEGIALEHCVPNPVWSGYFLKRDHAYGKWEGPNFERRKALCKHLLEKLEAIEAALPA